MIEQLIVEFNALPPGAKFVVLSFASVILAKLFQMFSLRYLRRKFRSWNEFGGLVYRKLHRPIYLTIAMVGIYFSINHAGIEGRTAVQMQRALMTLAILIWAYAINKIGDKFLEFVKETEDSRFDYEFAPVFENLWTTIIVIIASFWVVSGIWEINLTPFLASAGILGVVGGLAAKDAIANFFGGLALYFDNTYTTGDFIVLASGEEGIVTDIGIRSTTLKTRDDNEITVPNSVLNSSTVINESAPSQKARMEISVSVSYDSDLETVEECLVEAAEEETSVLENPSPRVRLREFGDNGINYDLLAWIPNPIEKIRTNHRLNKAVFKKLKEEDVEIPYPQRVVRMNRKERAGNLENEDDKSE